MKTVIPRVDTAPHGVGTPTPLAGCWGSWSQRAARVASLANVEVPPHPGRIGSHLRIRNTSVSLHLEQPGDENAYLPGRYRPAQCGNPNHTSWLLIGWVSWSQRMARVALEPTPSAAHGEVKVPSPDQKSIHISATPINRGPRQ